MAAESLPLCHILLGRKELQHPYTEGRGPHIGKDTGGRGSWEHLRRCLPQPRSGPHESCQVVNKTHGPDTRSISLMALRLSPHPHIEMLPTTPLPQGLPNNLGAGSAGSGKAGPRTSGGSLGSPQWAVWVGRE